MSRSSTKQRTTLASMIAAKGYTQCGAARQLRLSPNTVYAWCRGERRPWAWKAEGLAAWLGVQLDEVMAAWEAGRVSVRR